MADADRTASPAPDPRPGASADPRPGASTPPRLRAVGPALAGLAVALAALVHHGVGPALGGEDPAWYHPRGFLRSPLASLGLTEAGETVAALALPMAALVAAVFLTTRSAVARTLAVASLFATILFGYYGRRLTVVWGLYEGHWSATLTLFALTAAGAVCAVWLARSWRRLPTMGRAATYAPIFLFVLAFERNVTGTDDALRFALSPWPLVQVLALETFATAIAAILLGVGAGLLALHALRPRAGTLPAAGLAAAVAAGFPVGSLAVGSRTGLLAFQGGTALLLVTAAASLATLALAALPRRGAAEASAAAAGGPPARVFERGRLFATAALLLGAPLLLGQLWTRLDYVETRQVRARRIIEALDAYYAREGTYPDDLEVLVETGDLERVPEPRIGFAFLSRPAFRYDSFGTSYMLEFPAPRWIQCAYNPPWEDELAEEEDDDGVAPGAEGDPDAELAAGAGGDVDEASLAGAWSCPSNPPELW